NIPIPLLSAAGLIKRREEGTGHYDAFRNRIIFPIRDVVDRVIGFGGRTLEDGQAKYINSPQSALFDKSRCLYGLATAKNAFRESRRAVVVEGYVDCIMAQQHGFPEAVATLGTALTIDHVQVLRRYVDEVILLFDADSAGQKAANSSLPLFFTTDVELRLARVPEGKDPAELLQNNGPEPLAAALTSATGALESKWNLVLRHSRGDARGPDLRRAVEEFLGLIARSVGFGTCDPIQRGLLINRVGKLLGLSGEEVSRQLQIIARRLPASPASAPVPAPTEPATPVPNAAAAATRDLLEILLNDPGYYDSVRSQFNPDLLADEASRLVAREVVKVCEERGGFELTELLGRVESVELSRRIIDLQLAGERGGNFAARVEGAVTTLQKARDRSRVDTLMAEIRGDPTSESTRLLAAGEAARRVTHFAARRHLTATPVIVGAAPGDPHAADSFGGESVRP
ncbi:MAG TPA: toprim domain-containing protein, partial [Phycisphaerae bacterium]|nr:toprim domain-containing protein [Phycisphaerae bacterium]